jgi:nicotinamidase-related amidase
MLLYLLREARRHSEVRRHTMDRLDPARTALLVVHMAKGVAGQVDTPFNQLFRQRAEQTGVIGVQARLLDGFRRVKAKVVVTYQPGLPGVRPNSPLTLAALIRRSPSSLLKLDHRGRGS